MAAGVFELVNGKGRKYLTGDERERFIAAARADPRPAVQTFAATLAHTGTRISEVRIATLKRRREHWRCVPVPEALIHELELVHRLRRTQRSPRGRRTRLWAVSRATATRHVTELMAVAGIEGPQASAKGVRHAYGVAAVAAGVPLPTVAAVLGHASLNTTAIYTTAIGAEARELVARMWG